MIGARVLRNSEFSRQESGSDLGNEFFGAIGAVTKPFAEFTSEAMLGTGPVRQLMEERGVTSVRDMVCVSQNSPSSGIWI
jgi:hypothetical protein